MSYRVFVAGDGVIAEGLDEQQVKDTLHRLGGNNHRVQVLPEGEGTIENRTAPEVQYDRWSFGPTFAEAQESESHNRGDHRQAVHFTLKDIARAKQ